MAGAVVTLEPPLGELVVVGCRLMAARTDRGEPLRGCTEIACACRCPRQLSTIYAVITEGKKREMPALQSVDHLAEMRLFTWRKEMASVSVFDVTVARLRKPQQSARAFGPSFIDGGHRFEIQIVSVHLQDTQDSAGFAQIAAYEPLKIGNSATPPVFYRFRRKQVHPNEQIHGSNESLFSKKILSRFHNSDVMPILPIICQCDFLQEWRPFYPGPLETNFGPAALSQSRRSKLSGKCVSVCFNRGSAGRFAITSRAFGAATCCARG
jgi:hypothetical protein